MLHMSILGVPEEGDTHLLEEAADQEELSVLGSHPCRHSQEEVGTLLPSGYLSGFVVTSQI